MEPEVEAWLLTLDFAHYQRVMYSVDTYLVERGDRLDGDHTKALRDGVRELRVILGPRAWRLTYWLPGGRGHVIVLLTVFSKTREGPQKGDVDAAVKAKRTCEELHTGEADHVFERIE